MYIYKYIYIIYFNIFAIHVYQSYRFCFSMDSILQNSIKFNQIKFIKNVMGQWRNWKGNRELKRLLIGANIHAWCPSSAACSNCFTIRSTADRPLFDVSFANRI